jgi:hypothetical protein
MNTIRTEMSAAPAKNHPMYSDMPGCAAVDPNSLP